MTLKVKIHLYSRISLSWISLVSGIFLSSGLGILTNVMMSDNSQDGRGVFGITGLLFFIAAVFLFLFTTTLETPRQEWSDAGSNSALWNKTIEPYLRKLNRSASVALVCIVTAAALIASQLLEIL